MYMEEHNVLRSMGNGFCVYDSRGFNYSRTREAFKELLSWMSEGVHHNQLCVRYDDCDTMIDDMENDVMRSSSEFVQIQVNCVMVVANMAEIYIGLKASDSKLL
ncbi:hypothetical protein V6N13_068309 [Hibiscus sabdariffa]|uniref:Uncharacterized protein n=1 Tax=Hibiscus sabdariffa TaxID=183260 RepID=A0ABR2QM84_9ROSI